MWGTEIKGQTDNRIYIYMSTSICISELPFYFLSLSFLVVPDLAGAPISLSDAIASVVITDTSVSQSLITNILN